MYDSFLKVLLDVKKFPRINKKNHRIKPYSALKKKSGSNCVRLDIFGFAQNSKKTLSVPLNSPTVIQAPQLNASEKISEFISWKWYKEDEEVLNSERVISICQSSHFEAHIFETLLLRWPVV